MTETVTDHRRPMRSSIFMGLTLVAFALILLVAYRADQPTEMTFTPAQRVWLERERAQGRYVSASEYWFCDGRGFWVAYTADGSLRVHERRLCWWFMMRRTPNPEYDVPGM